MERKTRVQWVARVWCAAALLGLTGVAAVPQKSAAQDFEQPPISYSSATPDNAVSQLKARLAAGEAKLTHDEQFGYLKSVLSELEVPVSSQTLVFSKTSLQREKIAPRTPRALYFNDDVYVGYCQDGDVMEISVADPQLGTVFYTLDQQGGLKPELIRQTDSCLICHGSSHTQGVPGHVVRSVFADVRGLPILSSGTYRIDHTSPLEKRWGGWYVSGTHGEQKHLGNTIFRGPQRLETADVAAGMNLTDLGNRLDPSKYLSPHSDLIALMVLEHQTNGHNLIARANFLTRIALAYEADLNRTLNEAPDHRWDSTTSRIKDAGEPLVKYLLFSGEAALKAPLRGVSGFAEEFAARGPHDPQGRSLREFDLERRIFKYPCSYLIYSDSFDALPEPVAQYVWQRLWDILNGRDTSDDFAHLSSDDRQAILEILVHTKANLPEYWQ